MNGEQMNVEHRMWNKKNNFKGNRGINQDFRYKHQNS